MEWIRRNPKKAGGLSTLAVVCLVVLVWGLTGGSGTQVDEPSTLGLPSPLATPTRTPSRSLNGLPTPSGTPTSVSSGGVNGLPAHSLVISAGSDGPLLGVGWRIPTADGKRAGKDTSYQKSFRHATTVYGRPDYAQLYTRVGPDSSHVWCTVTVDGKVTERQEAHGPWGAVFCQG